MGIDYSLGVDFGTDSVRVVVVDCYSGEEVSSASHAYYRWNQGLYCDATRQQFRQHPADLIESWQQAVGQALAPLTPAQRQAIRGIGVDTTGSSPCAVDHQARPLALNPDFDQDPDAMVILWKDHSSNEEAARINQAAAACLSRTEDYLRFVGGAYSSEWFWAKMLHVFGHNPKVEAASAGWMEHSDWFPALLCGIEDVKQVKVNRCAAGHKAMWNKAFDGLPPASFLQQVDPLLALWRERLYHESWDMGTPMGQLSPQWARTLGLGEHVVVSVGMMDAHAGALGSGIREHDFVRIMGTSTCDIVITPPEQLAQRYVPGICGQVLGAVLPGYLALEAGQSSFGDCFNWLRDLLSWPLVATAQAGKLPANTRTALIEGILPELNRRAADLPAGAGGELALDWFNGRRTPGANQKLRAALHGLYLGSDAPALFRVIAESLAYGTRAILDTFEQHGVELHRVMAVGGVAHKSPLTLQILADVLQRDIHLVQSEQCCALGAAITGAMAAGVFPDWSQAFEKMASPACHVYHPNRENRDIYQRLYRHYLKLGSFVEKSVELSSPVLPHPPLFSSP